MLFASLHLVYVCARDLLARLRFTKTVSEKRAIFMLVVKAARTAIVPLAMITKTWVFRNGMIYGMTAVFF